MRLSVLTYNLKHPAGDGPHAWPTRRPLLRRQLGEIACDLLAVQEAHLTQLLELRTDLPRRYDWIGQGRDGGSRGEYCALLYDPSRLEPVEYGHFWLSDTPDLPGSRTPSWGNHNNARMATWARFRVGEQEPNSPHGAPEPPVPHPSALRPADASEVVVLNTHLDHESARARRYGVELIAARLRRHAPATPVVVCGDFNAPAGRAPEYHDLLDSGELRDCWHEAPGPAPDLGTYTGWEAPTTGGDRIDWVLLRGPLSVRNVGVHDYQEQGVRPSDHLPVRVDLTLHQR